MFIVRRRSGDYRNRCGHSITGDGTRFLGASILSWAPALYGWLNGNWPAGPVKGLRGVPLDLCLPALASYTDVQTWAWPAHAWLGQRIASFPPSHSQLTSSGEFPMTEANSHPSAKLAGFRFMPVPRQSDFLTNLRTIPTTISLTISLPDSLTI